MTANVHDSVPADGDFGKHLSSIESAVSNALSDDAIKGISTASEQILGCDIDRLVAAIGQVEALTDSLAETAKRFEAALDYQRSQTLSIRLDANGKPRWFRPNGTIMSRREVEDYFRALHGPIRTRHHRLQKIATALRVLASLGAYNAR